MRRLVARRSTGSDPTPSTRESPRRTRDVVSHGAHRAPCEAGDGSRRRVHGFQPGPASANGQARLHGLASRPRPPSDQRESGSAAENGARLCADARPMQNSRPRHAPCNSDSLSPGLRDDIAAARTREEFTGRQERRRGCVRACSHRRGRRRTKTLWRYCTETKCSPHAGAVGPASSRSRLARARAQASSPILPRPTSINVPAIVRTIL